MSEATYDTKTGVRAWLETALAEYDEFLTLAEVREVLNISKSKTYNIVRENKITSYTFGEKIIRIMKQDLIDYIVNNRN